VLGVRLAPALRLTASYSLIIQRVVWRVARETGVLAEAPLCSERTLKSKADGCEGERAGSAPLHLLDVLLELGLALPLGVRGVDRHLARPGRVRGGGATGTIGSQI
jgi:hypothetical protein